MEPHWKKHRVTARTRRSQAGITALGFLFLGTLIGIVALGGIKLVPVYLQHMRMSTVLDDLQQELDGSGKTPTGIRLELDKRFIVEGIQIPRESVNIRQVRDGYQIRVQHENRTPYIADVWLLVAFDKQIQIRR